MYAVILDGNKQYRVSKGDKVEIDLRDVEAGAKIEFDHILMVSGDEGVKVGAPTIANAKVTAVVAGETLGEKTISTKFRRCKDSKTRKGHRQPYTAIVIEEITV
jgi:large subunit ribosomal protein L21